MPEGHILHRLARLHHHHYQDKRVDVSSPQGRFTYGAALVHQQMFTCAQAWGKHLFHHYGNGCIVHIHLGIYGRFLEISSTGTDPIPLPGLQVRMRMATKRYITDLSGPTVCEVINTDGYEKITARLGPDPLRSDANPYSAWERIHTSTRPIAVLLLDQKIIAGIGNIYRSEILFRHHIHPQRSGKTITIEEFNALWNDTVKLMTMGLERGTIIVVDPEDDHGPESYAPGKPRTYVYQRSGQQCRHCDSIITSDLFAGRKAFWCPSCQQ